MLCSWVVRYASPFSPMSEEVAAATSGRVPATVGPGQADNIALLMINSHRPYRGKGSVERDLFSPMNYSYDQRCPGPRFRIYRIGLFSSRTV